MSEKLSLLDNSSDSEVDFTINEKYANAYDVWRNKEELQKYKDLKKEEDSESSSESEDEVPVSSDEEFLTALSICKSKDPRIYDKNYKQFKDEHQEKEEKIKKTTVSKEKPMYMKDYERNLVLEKGGKFSDEDEEEMIIKGSAYDQEQENLKKSFKEALGDSSDDDNDDDLLKVREKTANEKEAEEAEYMKWLKGEQEGVSEDVKKNLSYLHDYWNDPKLDEQEKFLRDYFLSKKYLEKDDSEIPTYEEITKGVLSDEEMLEEQEKFEVKYNFRFEEPDEEYIKRYPRNFADSLRKVDNRRKQKRDEKADRKRTEKLHRREELKRLKALKRKEIEEKFLKLKEVCGQEEINLNESDIESDFDPDKHDQKMREMFSDDYYQVEEEQKPVFPYDEELDSENWNTWTGERVDDEDNKNEADSKSDESDSHENTEIGDQNKVNNNPKEEFEKEMIEATLPKKRARKKSLFAKIVSQAKPLYDPDGKSFEEYLDEYYKLDYEDIIGDMPVRYKYRKVVPNDFGLAVDEILAADDRELNRWCSVKKTCQYRNEEEEMYDVQAYQKKSQNAMAKKKKFPSLFAPNNIGSDAVIIKNKKLKYVEEACSSAPDNEIIINDDEKQCDMDEDMAQNLNEAHSFVHGDKNKKKSKKNKKTLDNSEIQNPFNTSTKILDTTGSEVCSKYSEQNLSSENSSAEVKSKKKSKKKKHKKHDNSLLTANSEYLNTSSKSSYIESAMSKNISESSNPEQCDVRMEQQLNDTQDSAGYDEHKKRSKKKGKDRRNVSESTDTDTYSDKNNSHSSNLKISSQKSTKRKRDFDINPVLTVNPETEESCNNNVSSEKFCNSKFNVSNFNQPSSINVPSNSVSEISTEEPLRKKKKKKHSQNKNDTSNIGVSNYKQRNKAKAPNDQRHFENISGDKRLGLTDERLAAYGINPKKFKNKIMYSRK